MFHISKLDDFMNQNYGGETEKEFIDIVQKQFGTVVVNLLDYVTEFVHEERIKFEAMYSASNNNTEQQTKKCSNCDQLLSLSAFDKNKTSLFGLNSTCKACVSEHKRKDYLSPVIAKAKLPCKHCGRKFGNKHLLLQHEKLYHPSKEQLVVPNTFDTKSKICFMCPDRKEFKRAEVYHRHLATVHNMKGAYSCQKCNFTTFTEISLKKHINKKHAQTFGLNSTCKAARKACVSEDKRKDYLSTVIAKAKLPCKHCGLKFCNKNLLRRHEKLNHPSKEQLVVPNTFDTKSKICFMCPDRKEFKRVKIYHMHLATVHNMKGAYSCQKCNFTTFTEISLKKHINKKHAQKYVMKCPVQGCTFTCKDHAYKGRMSTKLYWHLRSIHGKNIVGASAVTKGTMVEKYSLKRKLTKVKASLGVPLHGMKTRTRVFKRQRV